jgi:valyl-tRNA synthetase
VTDRFIEYDYATAKSAIEVFFWNELADNYLELAKRRLYDADDPAREGARFVLGHVLMAILKLFAPFLPHITEEIYYHLHADEDDPTSIHLSRWPEITADFIDDEAEATGAILVQIATAVRRYKSAEGLSLGADIQRLTIAGGEPRLRDALHQSETDLMSVTRALNIDIREEINPDIVPTARIDSLVLVIDEWKAG